MSDVRIQNQYSVQGTAGKRDHHADSTLNTVRRRDEEYRRRHREHEHDSVELSDDGDSERPPEEDARPPEVPASQAPPADVDDDAPEAPGSHLNVQA